MCTLNISLPKTDIDFLQQYAQQQNLTVSEVIAQWVRGLQTREKPPLHPALAAITGILPTNLEVRDNYYQQIWHKHL